MQEWQPFDAAVALLNRSKAPALLVLDGQRQLVGILTSENIGEMMMVRSARPDWRFRKSRYSA